MKLDENNNFRYITKIDDVMTHPPTFCRRTISFMDVNIDVLDTKGLYEKIVGFVQDGRSHKVMYVNAHCMVISQRDEIYRQILNNAQLVYADGTSLVLGARLLGRNLPGRSTAADFMPGFCHLFSREGLRMYLLGGQPGVAEAAARKLSMDNEKLEIVGCHHGYFHPIENARIIENVNAADPDILLVGMGVPHQEKWIEAHFDQIHAPVIWAVGALFDFLSGRLTRGPQWLLDNGFEWLCRLFVEPRRLWKRYLIGNLVFLWFVLAWTYSARRKRG